MQIIRRLAFGMLVVACGGDGSNAELAAGSKARDAMCACKDSVCARNVEDDAPTRTFMASFREQEKVEVEGGKRVSKSVSAIVDQIRTCRDTAIDLSFAKAVRRKIVVMTEYRDKVCACKDAACAYSTDEAMSRKMRDAPLEESVTGTGTLGHKSTEDDAKLRELNESYDACARPLEASVTKSQSPPSP